MNQEKKQKRVQHTPKKIKESLSYSVEVRDKEGRILQRISAPSRSYVQQWNQLINLQATQYPKSIKDIGGLTRTPDPHSITLGAMAYAGSGANGMRAGKGTTAVAITDYALESPCEEGTGLDEFSHQQQTYTEPSVAGDSCSFTTRRTLINKSGATISGIKEIGCYVLCYKVPTSYSMLGFRDVLGTAVDVPDGGAITIEYTIGVTV